jgi:FkbM family methyltransferase
MAVLDCAFTIAEVTGHPAPEIIVLDIGAMPTGPTRYAPLVKQGCARVIKVEPSERSLARVPESDRKDFIPHFLGDGTPSSFHETHYPGCSSFLEPDEALINMFETIAAARGANFNVVAKREVETIRLDDLDDLPAIDFLKIDTQGSELTILENGTRALGSVLTLETEVEFVPLYKDQPLFGHLHVALSDQGFIMHKFVDLVGRPFRPWGKIVDDKHHPISQMLWADAIFVRDFTKLARFSDEALLKAATILNDVYLSYDLAFVLLRELDRRTGSTHARAYVEKFVAEKVSFIHYANFKGKA